MKKKNIKYIKIGIVNLITLTRLFGALSLPIFYHYKSPSDFALITIILFSTDMIDGFLARKLKVSTFFGAAIDAISDKLLNYISFILLGLKYNKMLTPLILEIAIMYTSYVTYRYGGNVQSSKLGKIKTIFLDVFVVLSFILILLPKFNINSNTYLIENTPYLITCFSYIINIFCILALLDYIKKYKSVRSNPKTKLIKYNKKDRKTFDQIFKDVFDTDYYQKHKNEPIMKQLYI